MSPREPLERVQAALRGEREPLAGTIERLEPVLRGRVGRLLLAGLLVGGGGLTAEKTGLLDLIVARLAAAPAKADEGRMAAVEARATAVESNQASMGKRVLNIDRKLNWLVRQEVRRQEREGRTAEPPEDVE